MDTVKEWVLFFLKAIGVLTFLWLVAGSGTGQVCVFLAGCG
jgi:hypothetical protein